MVESMNESSFYLVIQMGSSNENHFHQQLWANNYIDTTHQEIPMIRLQPFEHDTQPLYCIQKKSLEKLRIKLMERNYHILVPSRSHIRYVCHQNQIDEKAYEYMLRTKAYIEMDNVNLPENQGKVKHLLNLLVNKVKDLLQNLYDHHYITLFQYQQMDIERKYVRLDYLFFVPNLHQQESLIFKPIVISVLSPLMPICRYLNRLLTPIYYHQVARLITVQKGADIIPRLEIYQKQGYLQPTTFFVTIHIKDPYVSITHQECIETLQCFLDDFIPIEGGHHIQGMKSTAIIELTKLILHNQYFIYQQSIYQQILGSHTGLFFFNLLINIYLFYWQQPILLYQNQHEIFASCFNDLFFTWNESEEKLQHLLKSMKIKHPLIKYDINIQTKQIHYLDTQIYYNNDYFETYVYHNWKYEPYILPTIYQSSSIIPLNILRHTLIRAVLCCSQLEDFQHEQQYIEYAFLFNGFSFDFLRQHTEEFFLNFNVLDFITYPDQTTYDELRRYVRQFDEQKKKQKQKYLTETQKQCIWYIHSRLTGYSLIDAKRNPLQLLPSSYQNYIQDLEGIKIEVINVPNYPPITI